MGTIHHIKIKKWSNSKLTCTKYKMLKNKLLFDSNSQFCILKNVPISQSGARPQNSICNWPTICNPASWCRSSRLLDVKRDLFCQDLAPLQDFLPFRRRGVTSSSQFCIHSCSVCQSFFRRSSQYQCYKECCEVTEFINKTESEDQ